LPFGQLGLDEADLRWLYGATARSLRIERPGGRYHVTARGNERKEIYRDDTERLRVLRELRWSSYAGYAACGAPPRSRPGPRSSRPWSAPRGRIGRVLWIVMVIAALGASFREQLAAIQGHLSKLQDLTPMPRDSQKKMKYPLDMCVAIRYSVPMIIASAVRPPLPGRGPGAKKRPGRSPDNRSLWTVDRGPRTTPLGSYVPSVPSVPSAPLWTVGCGLWTTALRTENPGKSRKKNKNNPHPAIKPRESPQPI
jgi:hypothetical protein